MAPGPRAEICARISTKTPSNGALLLLLLLPPLLTHPPTSPDFPGRPVESVRLSLSSTVSLHRANHSFDRPELFVHRFRICFETPFFRDGERGMGERCAPPRSLISIPEQLCPFPNPFAADSPFHSALLRGSPFRKTTPAIHPTRSTSLLWSSDEGVSSGEWREGGARSVGVSRFLSLYPEILVAAVVPMSLQARARVYPAWRVCTPPSHLSSSSPVSSMYTHTHAHACLPLVLRAAAPTRPCVPCGERRSWHFRDTLRPEELPRALVGTFGINVMAPSAFAILCFVRCCRSSSPLYFVTPFAPSLALSRSLSLSLHTRPP